MTTLPAVSLRAVAAADLPTLFAQQRDAEANRLVAFNPRDPHDEPAFMAHWERVLANPEGTARAVLVDGSLAGYIVCFRHRERTELGYWLGREFWGRGIATAAVSALLQIVTERPIHAGVAGDNEASRRVLEKCGFRLLLRATAFSRARGCDVEELIFRLDA